MKLSLSLHVAYALIMSEIVVTAPLPDATSLSKSDPASGEGDATALYAYIAEDSELDGKKAKRDGDATALYAYIVEDSDVEDQK
ncbi:uncharacterized protein TRUGW13939_10378 [Talaromyces rugulosus]|uniref:Uncharacterized protein n=1 Tax=Talaromyces rugulosus TaxID=121627 RepID=A0A7H8R9V2_TALRU|nr:uncharacterized protein TRUGW13939_10378 [Talaromyces rugulosus]QKX63209.1 hypothetical protein TRUGW13939_10378 [Talaromyces rugulosus]